MKKLLLLFVLLTLSINVNAKNYDKEYLKLIQELDIDPTAKKATSVEDFWDLVLKKNSRAYQYYIAYKKKKASAIKAHKIINQTYVIENSYLSSLHVIIDDSDSSVIKLVNTLGFKDIYPKTKLFVVKNDEMNAFAVPDGRIYLNNGLFVDGINYPQLLGICAHEFSHFLLQHAETRIYRKLKEEKRNNLIAGISSAVNIAAGYYAGSNGVDVDWKAIKDNTQETFEEASIKTKRYRYKYSRKQEIEADIIAYRLLDFLGYGGEKYIEALEVIRKNEILPQDENNAYNDHPSTAYRIELLRYMQGHPNIVRDKPKNIFSGNEFK